MTDVVRLLVEDRQARERELREQIEMLHSLIETGTPRESAPIIFGKLILKADLVSKEYNVMMKRSQSTGLLNITFIVNADGEKEVPIVIWKSEKPRCFKGINVSRLPTIVNLWHG